MADSPPDQAAGLRHLTDARPVRVIAVASGKGGVGKTSVSVNLAVGLSQLGRRVMLLDADLGLANVDVMLGLQPRANLSHVLDGSRTLEEVLVDGPGGVRIVPASSGIARMADLSPAEHGGLIRAFSTLTMPLDVLIVDTAAGVSDAVARFTRAAQEILVVVCDEPASITDAYALIKVLSRDHGVTRFRMLANMVPGEEAGQRLYRKLSLVCDRFLDVVVRYAGAIPYDQALRAAIQRQRAVVEATPACPASRGFKKLARAADSWSMHAGPQGHLEFFVERMVAAVRAPGDLTVAGP